jgi:ubiquinone/menaquinone biosynthesis C-methylase UbiE
VETDSLRTDYVEIMRSRGEKRPPERLIAHYNLERELARRIRDSAPADRPGLYGEVYDQLFNALSDHPQHQKNSGPSARYVQHTMHYLAPFLSKKTMFLEIGCGDAAVSIAASEIVRQAIGADVQDKLLSDRPRPSNFRFVKLSGGPYLPFDASTIDVTSSDQLIEHLHPEDVVLHLQEVARVLKPGGTYICTTPSALTGPHDISMYFEYVANGLHIKEYSYKELSDIFRAAGFKRLQIAIRAYRRQVLIPAWLGILAERCFSSIPISVRSRLARTRIAERLLGANVIARK